jgi:hypothetical protein
MRTITCLALLAGSVALLGPSVARAEDDPGIYSHEWNDSRMRSGIGISATLGAGIGGFTSSTMRDVASDVGGLWDLHVTVGSHTPIGLDVSYIGTAAKIDALIGPEDGTLVGTAVETALRYNILPQFKWNPYVFAGVGWQRYDITGGTFRLSDTGMNESDNSIVFPLGAGVTYRDRSGFIADVRATFRPDVRAGLVLEDPISRDYAPMHTWAASAAAGYEF